MEGLITKRTIGIILARELQKEAIKAAKEIGIAGFVVVCSASGAQLCSEAVNDQTKEMSSTIASAKVRTAHKTGRSTSVLCNQIKKTNRRPENYVGVETLFAGGLAIFIDPERKEIVGFVAFSGGEEKQDQSVCRLAIMEVGLYTDDEDLV